jgi:SAM-dependent methyltransferase
MWHEKYSERLSHEIQIWMLYPILAYGLLLLQKFNPQFQLIKNLGANNIAVFLDCFTLVLLVIEFLGVLKYSMMNAKLSGADEYILSVDEGYQHWSKSFANGNGVIAVERELTSLNLEFHNFDNKRVLDFGCGIGHYTQKLLSFNANVIAIDANESMLEEFNKGIPVKPPQCQIIHGGVEALTKIPLNSLDAVIACLVIDHLADSQLEAFFRLSFGALKNNGLIYISDVNPYFAILSHRYAKFIDQDGIESRIRVEPHPIPEVIEQIAGAGFQRLQMSEGKVPCKEAFTWIDLHGIEGFPLIIGYKAFKPN